MDERRRLGEHERLISSEQPFSGVLVLQVLHLSGEVDAARLRAGLDWLQRRHPMLRVHLRYGAPVFRSLPPFVYRQPWFETRGTGPIPLRETSAPWRDVVAAELKTRLARGRTPRLRFTLVRDPAADMSHLVICADHATLDASSCAIMSRQLLEYLTDPRPLEALPEVEGPLPAPLDDGLPARDARRTTAYQPAVRLPRRPIPRGSRGTRIHMRRMTATETDALKAAARKKGATLHGTIAGAFMLAMRELYGLEEMTCLSSVDLRKVVRPPLPPETYGCFVDVLRTRHRIAPELWPTARDVSFKLIAAIAKDQQAASMIKLPGWGALAAETLPTLTHRGRIDGLAITTAGESGLRRTYGNHTLEDVTMAVSLDIVGPGLMVIGVEREGALDISVCHAAHTLPEDDALAMADRAMAALREAARG